MSLTSLQLDEYVTGGSTDDLGLSDRSSVGWDQWIARSTDRWISGSLDRRIDGCRIVGSIFGLVARFLHRDAKATNCDLLETQSNANAS